MRKKKTNVEIWDLGGKIIEYGPDPKEWTIIAALDRLNRLSENTQLSEEFWKRIESPLAFLTEKLELTKIQAVLMAMICENGDTMGWKDIADYLDVSRLSVMGYADELKQLVERGLLHMEKSRAYREGELGYFVDEKALKAYSQNIVYVPENYSGLTMQKLVDTVVDYVGKLKRRSSASSEEHIHWIENLVDKNTHLPLCAMLARQDLCDKVVFMLLAVDYARWGNVGEDGEEISKLMDFFADDAPSTLDIELMECSNQLFKLGYIEHQCVDGMARTDWVCLTDKAKDEFFAEYSFTRASTKTGGAKDRDIKECKEIVEKNLYYNEEEEKQIKNLSELLSDDKLKEVHQRLEEEGMRKGFACLFYGAPGTGKTETVLQLARMTGRDVMQIDISSIRDKYVGESEKNLKAVFQRYKKACKKAEKIPILFFNEADAIFSKRLEKLEHSVDGMYNALQNILLQELEDLQGILIATTNLTNNLDSAFERRFLFKIEFHKPDAEVKAKIWSSMMKHLSEEDALVLANQFDFSGGQIENITRKCSINYVLTGERPTLDELIAYCKEEQLSSSKERKSIGFHG